jgi:adenosylhomocysteine nucleosidase
MTGIIGAMEAEVALLRDAMAQEGEVAAEADGPFTFYTGTLDGKSVVLLQCGIGKVNAAVGCALLIKRYAPGLVINTGSAGGIDTALTFGDLVISDGLLYYDVDVTPFNYAPGQVPGCPPVFLVPESLAALAEQAMDVLKAEGVLPPEVNHRRGHIASGDLFMHEEAKIAVVKKTFPAVKAVEMEGAAIAQSCFLFKTPFIIIRSISDVAGKESPMTFDEFLPLASSNSAALVRRIVASGGEGR